MYQELSNKDREFIKAMTESGKASVKVAEIAKKMHRDKNYISIYRRRLLDDQLITATKWGEVAFTLPFFADFIKEYQTLY